MQNKKFNPWRFIGIALAAILTISAFSGSAQASGTSLVDILQAKGVLTQGEAKAAKVDAKKHHKHLKFGGRIMVDYAAYLDDPGLDLGDGFETRRARLFAKGKFGDFHFKGQYDFANNGVSIKDLYIKYTGFKIFNITVGNFHEQFSLEELTSSKYITFMERGLPNAFAPGRKLGVGIGTHGDFWSGAVGVFGGSVGSNGANDSAFDLTGRVTVAPFHEKGRVLHLGGAVAYRIPASVAGATPAASKPLRFRERPESHVTGIRLVDTGTMTNVDNYITYGLEAAAVYGPVSVQGEYVRTDVNFQNTAAQEPNFSGFYVYTSWFITGESRPYSVKHGTFGRVHPNNNLGANGWGAFEVAGRFSQLDLEDQLITGGKEQDITVGLNWYPHPHVRFMFNWVHASVDRSPIATVVRSNFSPDVVEGRAQLDF